MLNESALSQNVIVPARKISDVVSAENRVFNDIGMSDKLNSAWLVRKTSPNEPYEFKTLITQDVPKNKQNRYDDRVIKVSFSVSEAAMQQMSTNSEMTPDLMVKGRAQVNVSTLTAQQKSEN